MKSVKTRIITILLALCLLVPTQVSQAAQASPQTDEYAVASVPNYVATQMNRQLIAALSGSSGTKAKIEASSYKTYQSEITFTFDRAKLDSANSKGILPYVGEAIDENPNFCTLSTSIMSTWYADKVLVTVYSMLPKNQHAKAIRKYKTFLANIEYIPKQAGRMSDREILLYLHDRLIQHANYYDDTDDLSIHIPYTMSDTGNVVCQSYAAVLNHMMRDLGFTSYAIWSPTHAWNVVKLEGKWFCIDATWDDPKGRTRDNVSHEFFLVPLSRFNKDHTLADYAVSRFSSLESKLTYDYSYLPKSNGLTEPVCFRTGVWFYVKNGTVYRWDGSSNSASVESAIPSDTYRCVNVLNHTVFVGGTDGIYKYDPDAKKLIPVKTDIRVEGLLYLGSTLYYLSGNTWSRFITYEPEGVTYESLNGSANKETVKLTKPGKPTVSTVKSSAKSVRVSVTTAAKNANAGYQVQVANNSSFSLNKKSKTISGTRVNITNLTQGKTYYVRVRGIWKKGYLKKYGKWSTVKTFRNS